MKRIRKTIIFYPTSKDWFYHLFVVRKAYRRSKYKKSKKRILYPSILKIRIIPYNIIYIRPNDLDPEHWRPFPSITGDPEEFVEV